MGFHWDDYFDLKKEMQRFFSCDIYINNDVNVIGDGESMVRIV
jgi:predicted NBD/HSP70 family sugar kinase